ncbi:MAG: BMC domain-containing protein [Bacteroidota bacterium]
MAAFEESALGFVETRGLVVALEAADAMLKAAHVHLLNCERTDPALITISVSGEVSAVQAAVEAGRMAAERVGEVVSWLVIPRPYGALGEILGAASDARDSSDVSPRVPPFDEMTVRELRAMARELGGLPIQGREIARARKDELISFLKKHFEEGR